MNKISQVNTIDLPQRPPTQGLGLKERVKNPKTIEVIGDIVAATPLVYLPKGPPTPVSLYILIVEYGKGIKSLKKNSAINTIDLPSRDYQTNQVLPGSQRVAEIISPEGVRRYRLLSKALNPDFKDNKEYLVHIGELVKVLTAEESAQVLSSFNAAGEGGLGGQIGAVFAKMPYYKYIKNGKEIALIIPRADVDKINTIFDKYYTGKITREEALKSITDIQSLNQAYNIKGVGLATLLRDTTNLADVFAGLKGKTVSADSVNRFLQTFGITGKSTSKIGELVAGALAIKAFVSGDTRQGWMQVLDIMPSFVSGYSNSEILNRLNLITKQFNGKDVTPQMVNELMKDPLINMALAKMSLNSSDFANLAPKDAIKSLLLFKDAFEGKLHPLQIAQELQSIPNIERAFPKINGISVVQLANSIFRAYDSFKNRNILAPETLETIFRALNINTSLIKNLNLNKATEIYNIYLSLQKAAKDPVYLDAAVQRAAKFLPILIPGVDTGQLLAGIFKIVRRQGDPKVIMSVLAQNKSLRDFIEKTLGIDLFDEKGNIKGLNLEAQKLASLVGVFSDVLSGKMLPLTAAAKISELNLIKGLPKVNGIGVLELASSMDNILRAFNKKDVISSKDLSNLFAAAKIDPKRMGIINPRTITILGNAVNLFTAGKKTAAIKQLVEFLPDILSNEKEGRALSAAIQILTSSKQQTIEQMLDAIESDPAVVAVMKNIGIPITSPPVTNYLLPNGVAYQYTGSNTVGNPYTIVGTEGEQVYVNNGATTELMTIQQAQSLNAKVDPALDAKETDPITKANAFSRVPLDEKLMLVSALKDLANGKSDPFQAALIICSLPSLSKVFSRELQYVAVVGKLSTLFRAASGGKVVDPTQLNLLISSLKININGINLGQAVALYGAYTAFEKGDYASMLTNVVNAFPNIRYADVISSFAKNLDLIRSGKPVEIAKMLYQRPEIRKFLANYVKIGGNIKGLDFVLNPNAALGAQKTIPISDVLMAGGIILDAVNGKINPIVAAKQLQQIPALATVFPSAMKTLNIATTLYDTAVSFGNTPINPADVDQALKLLGISGGIGALSYGEILGIVNGITLLFQGKWQQAMMQALTLLNITFGGIPVGVIIQVLFMIFPGLANIFGKGGGSSDKPKVNCQHCGCSTPDPAGTDNSRDWKPGGLLCLFCGSEVRSGKKPKDFAGSPPPGMCGPYPLGPNCSESFPQYRSALKSGGCSYVDGNVTTKSNNEVPNKDCKKQFIDNGPIEVANLAFYSLFCKDTYAYYGNFDGSGAQGENNDKKYNEDKLAKGAGNPAQYMIKVSPLKKSRFYADTNMRSVCESGGQFAKDCNTAYALWALIKDESESAENMKKCGFIDGITASPLAEAQTCDTLRKQIIQFYNGLSSAYRDPVFNSLHIINDTKNIRKLVT